MKNGLPMNTPCLVTTHSLPLEERQAFYIIFDWKMANKNSPCVNGNLTKENFDSFSSKCSAKFSKQVLRSKCK